MKKRFFLLLIFIPYQFIFAQNEFDALRYADIDNYGDARFNAMGGSFGALGANFSSLSINPGGIGVYNSSDFSLSTGFHFNHSISPTDEKGKLNFHIPSIGLQRKFKGKRNWEHFNFAIGYNRTSNFNNKTKHTSISNQSRLTTYTNALNQGGGTLSDDIYTFFPFSAALAYGTYLVNPLVLDSTKYSHVLSSSTNIKQSVDVFQKGGSGDYYCAFGGNYSNKLYLGGMLYIPSTNYTLRKTYKETVADEDTLTDLKEFNITDEVNTEGSGFGIKLGAIYKASNWLRLGAAFHTPTIYSLTDNYSTTITSNFKDGLEYTENSPEGNYKYRVITPYKAIASMALVFGKHGVVNFDYEFVDYVTTRLYDQYGGESEEGFNTENNAIKTNFTAAHNLRVGTEWRLDPLRFRLGYRYKGSAINENFTANTGSSIYSIGGGIKTEEYYFDVAYSIKNYSVESPIVPEYNQFSTINLVDHYLVLTIGFRF